MYVCICVCVDVCVCVCVYVCMLPLSHKAKRVSNILFKEYKIIKFLFRGIYILNFFGGYSTDFYKTKYIFFLNIFFAYKIHTTKNRIKKQIVPLLRNQNNTQNTTAVKT